MNIKVMLVDDDPLMHKIVEAALGGQFVIRCSLTVADAKKALELNEPPSLVILDRSLPDGDGLEICTQMRATFELRDIPIIFLSGKDSETDKVGGFFAGADDYICKPVSPLELKARVHARLRKLSKNLRFGKLSIDLASHKVCAEIEGKTLSFDLTRIEFKLLVTLAQSPDRIFTRETLLDIVWGHSVSVSDRVVDTHMSHLRRKVAEAGLSITALRGEGYRISLVSEDHRHAA